MGFEVFEGECSMHTLGTWITHTHTCKLCYTCTRPVHVQNTYKLKHTYSLVMIHSYGKPHIYACENAILALS